MRKFAGGWVATVFIGLLVLSFAVFGINDIFTGGNNNVLARVGDQDVTLEEYQAAYERRVNELRRVFNQGLSLERQRALGLPRQTLDQLIDEAVLDEQAARLGLSRSEESVAREVVDGGAFVNPTSGQFDRNLFRQVLFNNGLNEATYIALETSTSGRRQVSDGIAAELPLPTALEDALSAFNGERRTVVVADIPAPAPEAVAPPDETVLAAYFEQNADRFRAPETRDVTFLVLEPAELAAGIEITDEDVEAAYDARLSDYRSPERRTVQQLAFDTTAEAEAAAARLADGLPFEALADELGVSPSSLDLGALTRGEILDEAVADAVFGLDAPGVTAPIEGAFRTVIARVVDIAPEATRPLTEVEGELRRELAERQAAQTLLDVYDAVEDGRAGGERLGEIAERLGTDARIVTGLRADGRLADGSDAGAPDAPDLLPSVFRADRDFDPFPIETATGYVFYQIDEIEEERARTLQEARAEVETAWREEEAERIASQLARALVEAARATGLADAAAAEGVALREVGPFTRGDAPFEAATARQIFTTAVNDAGSGAARDGGRVVFEVVSSDVRAAANAVDLPLGTEIYDQFLAAARAEIGVEIDEDAVARALGEADLEGAAS